MFCPSNHRGPRLQTKVNPSSAELGRFTGSSSRELGRDLDDSAVGGGCHHRAEPRSPPGEDLSGSGCPLTGIALTKLDGTAKGGIVLALASELELAVKLVGEWGEQYEDLPGFRWPGPLWPALFGGGGELSFWGVKR